MIPGIKKISLVKGMKPPSFKRSMAARERKGKGIPHIKLNRGLGGINLPKPRY